VCIVRFHARLVVLAMLHANAVASGWSHATHYQHHVVYDHNSIEHFARGSILAFIKGGES
jgi:hypothetical protein